MVSLEQISDSIPAYAKDLRLNLSSVLAQTELTIQQTWGTAVATAHAARNPSLYRAISVEAEKHLSKEALEAAKSAAAIMGMNNIYYRFQHLGENEKYATIPARLRMNVIRTHGTDPLDFELQATLEPDTPLPIAYDVEHARIALPPVPPGRITIALTLSGSRAFGAAFREAFPEAD